MDPIAHSLFGAAVSRTPWARRIPAAMFVLVVAANLPDVDAATYFLGSDRALLLRRGLTHGPLGWLLLILLQLGGLTLWHRRQSRLGKTDRPLPLLAWTALTVLGVLSHPLLDWLNTYGVRFLMPFDRSWFQADAVFIVDPWMWWTLGAAVVLGSELSPRLNRAAVAATVLATIPVLVVAPNWARLLWLAALVLTWMLGRRLNADKFRGRVAAVLLATFVLYISLMLMGARAARWFVADELDRRGIQLVDAWVPEAQRLMVGPVPVTPWRRDVVARTTDGYRFGSFSWLPRPSLVLDPEIVTPVTTDELQGPLASAWRDPCVVGFVNWVRFPWAAVSSAGPNASDARARVHLYDARYVRRPAAGFATATVEVDVAPESSSEGGEPP